MRSETASASRCSGIDHAPDATPDRGRRKPRPRPARPRLSGRRGPAYEAAMAWIPLVKSIFGYETVYAITVPENERSIRLLKKLLFEQQDMIEHEGEKLMVWRRVVGGEQ